ncbi:DUF4333 domain-containing protein [Streptomyces sp. NPDC051840]|uniref:DUF4333 domain-containing protein n=1 Tax=unclassified Streptomyces TaxID=2593676 RepID=UPI003418E87B
MTEENRRFPRSVAFCSFVVAACAVVVTVKVLTFDTVRVESPPPPRVLDQTALEEQVRTYANSMEPSDAPVLCPLSVVVTKGAEFECTVHDDGVAVIEVEIVDEQGRLSLGRP